MFLKVSWNMFGSVLEGYYEGNSARIALLLPKSRTLRWWWVCASSQWREEWFAGVQYLLAMCRVQCVTCCGRTRMIDPAGASLHVELGTRSARTFRRRSIIPTNSSWSAVHTSSSWRYVHSSGWTKNLRHWVMLSVIVAIHSHRRSFDFDTNQKHVCAFVLVVSSNFGPLLHHFGDTAT